MNPVYHGIVTNALGRRGEGFRSFFLAPEWPAGERAAAERWLRSLRPMPERSELGVTVNCFRFGGLVHACVATLDSGFARDEYGRGGGFLVHAVLTPLDESRPVGDFGTGLLQLARSMPRPEVGDSDRLESYLSECKVRAQLTIPKVDLAAVFRLDEETILRLFHVSSSILSGRLHEVSWPRIDDLPNGLMLASSVLPPRLRLHLRWAYEMRPASSDTFLALVAQSPAIERAPRSGPAWQYLEWLRRRWQQHESQRIFEVTSDWQIASWRQLLEEVGN